MQAYVSSLEDSQSTLVLELGNIHPLPLEIVDVTFNDEILIPERSVVLESKRPFEAVRFVSASFSNYECNTQIRAAVNNIYLSFCFCYCFYQFQ